MPNNDNSKNNFADNFIHLKILIWRSQTCDTWGTPDVIMCQRTICQTQMSGESTLRTSAQEIFKRRCKAHGSKKSYQCETNSSSLKLHKTLWSIDKAIQSVIYSVQHWRSQPLLLHNSHLVSDSPFACLKEPTSFKFVWLNWHRRHKTLAGPSTSASVVKCRELDQSHRIKNKCSEFLAIWHRTFCQLYLVNQDLGSSTVHECKI